MPTSLDLAVLDTGTPLAVAFARTESRFAAEPIQCGDEMKRLVQFRTEIDRSLRGEAKRPTDQELSDFGKKLYDLLIKGSVRDLFEEASRGGGIRLHLISNHPTVQSLPWEFLCEPNGVFGPQRDRAVVRVHLGTCKQHPTPLLRGTPLRVVLAYAEPRNQEPVPWPEVENNMKVTFQARMPEGISLDVVRAATAQGIHDAVSLPKNPCHILHFVGHGVVRDGKGYVVLSDHDLDATELALLLGDCGIRMVVLSACDTATGDFDADFSVTAESLLQNGIPVVLANQLPIPAASVAPFVGAFYRHLLGTGDIDRAVAEARIALRLLLRRPGGEANIEWGIPTLYRTIDSHHFFAQ